MGNCRSSCRHGRASSVVVPAALCSGFNDRLAPSHYALNLCLAHATPSIHLRLSSISAILPTNALDEGHDTVRDDVFPLHYLSCVYTR
jgi:hypothetical protein